MKKLSQLLVFVFAAYMAFTGFECASTEMTSAKLYIQQKNYDKALDALTKETEKNPKSDEGFYLLGYLYGEKEDFAKMIANYDKSLSVSKKFQKEIDGSKKFHWANFFNKGVGYFNRASTAQDKDSIRLNFEKSIVAFNNAILCQPDSADTYKNLAFVYMNMQRYDEAVGPLEKLIALQKSVDGYRFLGEIYYNKGAVLKDNYEAKKDPQDSVKAIAEFNKAIIILEEGRKHHPNDSEILAYLSNAYISAYRIDEALTAFKTGVEQEPENKNYRYNYGVLLLGSNRFEEAIIQFKKALAIDKDYLNATYNVAVAYVKWGAVLAKEADAAGKENPDVKVKYRESLPYLEGYLSKKTDEAPVWELLGKVYSVLSMTKEAEAAFAKADAIRKGTN